MNWVPLLSAHHCFSGQAASNGWNASKWFHPLLSAHCSFWWWAIKPLDFCSPLLWARSESRSLTGLNPVKSNSYFFFFFCEELITWSHKWHQELWKLMAALQFASIISQTTNWPKFATNISSSATSCPSFSPLAIYYPSPLWLLHRLLAVEKNMGWETGERIQLGIEQQSEKG